MENSFNENKQSFLDLDRTLQDIEVMRVFGGGWRGKQEMLLRVLYNNQKRIITTVHEDTWQDELKTLILRTRIKYRDLKLSRICDENI